MIVECSWGARSLKENTGERRAPSPCCVICLGRGIAGKDSAKRWEGFSGSRLPSACSSSQLMRNRPAEEPFH